VQRKAGPPPTLSERAKGWVSGKRPLAFVAVLLMAVLIAAPAALPTLTNANAQPTVTPVPDTETPVFTPTPTRDSLSAPKMRLRDTSKYGANIATAKGTIRIDLTHQDAPLSTNNLVALSRANFYQGSTVYKVETGKYIALGGLNEDGTGTPGYTIDPDASSKPASAGSVAMLLQSGKVSSQLIITTADGDPGVPHVVVGKVIDGLDIVRDLKVGDKINRLNISETR